MINDILITMKFIKIIIIYNLLLYLHLSLAIPVLGKNIIINLCIIFFLNFKLYLKEKNL